MITSQPMFFVNDTIHAMERTISKVQEYVLGFTGDRTEIRKSLQEVINTMENASAETSYGTYQFETAA